MQCTTLKEVLLPPLTGLIASLREGHEQHPLLPTLEALDWLREVWLQDLPLKLAKYGDRFRAQLPAAVHAVESHRDWPAFRGLVLQQDQKSKLWAAVNRAFSGNPVAVLQHLQAGSSSQAPSCAADQDGAAARPCHAAKQVRAPTA